MIRYYKLFTLLDQKGMQKTDLLEIMASTTLAKLSKGEVVKTSIIDKICNFLNCQPGDIMECYSGDKLVGNDEKEKAIKEILTPDIKNVLEEMINGILTKEEQKQAIDIINERSKKDEKIKKDIQNKYEK